MRLSLAFLAGIAVFVSSASASSLPACSLFSGYTLGDMVGQGCAVGDKFFYDFESTSPESLLDSITFSPLTPLISDPGFELSGFTAAAGKTTSLNLTYTVQVIPSPGNSFTIRTPEFSLPSLAFSSGGSLSGTAGYCEKGQGDAETCTADGGTLYSAPISAAPPSTSFSSSVNIPQILSVDVALDLTLYGGASGSATGPINERFAQVATPEPATFFLIGSGLLVAARVRRKPRLQA